MKKILSVVLAVMMIFGSFAISASAKEAIWNGDSWNGQSTPDQCTIRFDFNGGKPITAQPVYDVALGKFVYTTDVPDPYIMYPISAESLVAGKSYIWMPDVAAPSGSKIDYWEVEMEFSPDGFNQSVPVKSRYNIPAGAAGRQITFIAHYSATAVEEDTLGTVLGILTKVFGAIIGILLFGGDTEAGVAMMEKILGGLDL